MEGLQPGLYRLHWKEGGTSLAAVGCFQNGNNWFACCNWTAIGRNGIINVSSWDLVGYAELLYEAGPALPMTANMERHRVGKAVDPQLPEEPQVGD